MLWTYHLGGEGQGCLGMVTSLGWLPCAGDIQLRSESSGYLPTYLMRFGVLSLICILPSLSSIALCLSTLVLSLQCDVPLGGCREEGQPGWLER